MSAPQISAARGADGRLTFAPAVKPRDFWTDKLDARLRILAPDYSASQIATLIGATRNAVIGRCRRQGIDLASAATKTRRVKREPSEPKPPKVKVARIKPLSALQRGQRPHAYPNAAPGEVALFCADLRARREAAMVAPTADWQPSRVAFLDLREGHCRWPLWTGNTPFSDKFFCGNAALTGKPYCQNCATRSTAATHVTRSMDSRLGILKAVAT